jgi:hypothetical protein
MSDHGRGERTSRFDRGRSVDRNSSPKERHHERDPERPTGFSSAPRRGFSLDEPARHRGGGMPVDGKAGGLQAEGTYGFGCVHGAVGGMPGMGSPNTMVGSSGGRAEYARIGAELAREAREAREGGRDSRGSFDGRSYDPMARTASRGFSIAAPRFDGGDDGRAGAQQSADQSP